MVEILGIISLTLQLLTAIDGIVSFFDSVENSPRALRSFYNSVKRLERSSRYLEDIFRKSNPTKLELTDDERAMLGLKEVDQVLEAAKSLLQGWQSNLSRGPLGNIIWNLFAGRQLDEQRSNIERIYLEVFNPMWFELILDILHDRYGGQQPTPTILIPATLGNVAVNPAVSELSALAYPRRESLRTFYNLPFIDPEDETEVDWPEHWEDVSTTMILDKTRVDPGHNELKLAKMQIMFRNGKGRILHFISSDGSIRVKHVVPFGSIPFTDKPNSKCVEFLDCHVVTVIENLTSESHHVYTNVRPKYHFSRSKTRRLFQSLARERDLIDEFYATEITAKHITGEGVMSRCQVIRIWGKMPEITTGAPAGGNDEPPAEVTVVETKAPIVTMSFLPNLLYDGRTHKELNLSAYLHMAEFVRPRVLGFSPRSKSDIIKLAPRDSELSEFGKLKFKFGTVQDATKFKDCYSRIHPTVCSAPPILVWEPQSSELLEEDEI